MEQLTASLIGTAVGGLIGGGATVLANWLPRRSLDKALLLQALRVWRDDIYTAEKAMAATVGSGAWWTDADVPEVLATAEDVGRVARALPGDGWEAASGARRRFLTFDAQRRAVVRPAPPTPQDIDDLISALHISEAARMALASKDRKWKFHPHPSVEDLRAKGKIKW